MSRCALAFICVAMLLAGCTPRGEIALVPEVAAMADKRSVFVGTNRALADGPDGFGPERGKETRFLRYDVAIPLAHAAGELRWPRPGRRPDPGKDFVVADMTPYADAAQFQSALRRALAGQDRGHRDVIVFVHGYNTRHAEGIYRLAQLAHDLKLPGVAVHYAWPSAGEPLVYAYDRDSALFARDGLEALLTEVAATGPDRIILIAHSMGSLLTMETLRQIAIGRRGDLMGRIGGVVLISPDVDLDVFRSQARRIARLPQPFLILTSQRDRALAVSALLTGQHERLGHIGDVSKLAEFDVTVLDVSAFSTGLGHFALGDSPALIRLVGSIGEVDAAFGRDPSARPGLLPGTVINIRRATQIVLNPLERLAQAGR